MEVTIGHRWNGLVAAKRGVLTNGGSVCKSPTRGQAKSFSACSSELAAEVRAMRLRSDRMRQTPSKTPNKSN
jgi:hypothetical protein